MSAVSNLDSDGFILVKKGHKLCASGKGFRKLNTDSGIPPAPGNFNVSGHLSPCLLEKIGKTNFAKSFLASFSEILKTHPNNLIDRPILDIVVYGLGSFGNCRSSLLQLAFIIFLKDEFSSSHSLRIFAFDPVFVDEERHWLEVNGVTVLEVNERCLRSVSTTTLFFLPHCCRSMYNNLLYANWNRDSLRSVFILGNSFSNMTDWITTFKKQNSYKYLTAAGDFCVEIRLPCSKEDDTHVAFSDQSLHYFSENVALPFLREATPPDYVDLENVEMGV